MVECQHNASKKCKAPPNPDVSQEVGCVCRNAMHNCYAFRGNCNMQNKGETLNMTSYQMQSITQLSQTAIPINRSSIPQCEICLPGRSPSPSFLSPYDRIPPSHFISLMLILLSLDLFLSVSVCCGAEAGPVAVVSVLWLSSLILSSPLPLPFLLSLLPPDELPLHFEGTL